MSINVAIVDDHPLAITGLCNMLLDDDHIKVVQTYLNGTSLLEGLKEQQPDVLLMDIQLPDIPGEELAVMVHQTWPKIRILVITSQDATVQIKRMLRIGCMGYLLKNTDIDTLILAIEEVYKGNEFIEPSLKERMLRNLLHFRKQEQKAPTITRRELEILHLIIAEYTNQEIADKLFLSLRTVEKHRFSLLGKLDARNTAGLVKTAIEMGLISPK